MLLRDFYLFEMAGGLWNKIKNGFKKAGKVIRNVARTITDKVIKPFKPILSGVANAVHPKLGKVFDVGMGAVETLSNEGWGGVKRKGAETASEWAQNRFKK